jgi:hypothetical protein
MPNNTQRKRRRKRASAIAQRRLPLDAPAHPREEYRLRDLIERLDLVLDTYIGEGDRAVIEAAAAYLSELYLARTCRGGAQ